MYYLLKNSQRMLRSYLDGRYLVIRFTADICNYIDTQEQVRYFFMTEVPII